MKTITMILAVALAGTTAACSGRQGPAATRAPAAQGEAAMAESAETTDKIEKSEAEWRDQLTPEQFRIARQKGTERAFSGSYWDAKEKGAYTCVCCGQPLFSSDHKFGSGTGWPSYWQPIGEQAVVTESDSSLGVIRVEVLCSRCGAHLGHVFEDGPKPTGLRYCINSASLGFDPE